MSVLLYKSSDVEAQLPNKNTVDSYKPNPEKKWDANMDFPKK